MGYWCCRWAERSNTILSYRVAECRSERHRLGPLPYCSGAGRTRREAISSAHRAWYRLGNFGIGNGRACLGGRPTRSAHIPRGHRLRGGGVQPPVCRRIWPHRLYRFVTSSLGRVLGSLPRRLSFDGGALVLGVVATARGLGLAVDLSAAAIAMVSVATLILAVARPRSVSDEHGRP